MRRKDREQVLVAPDSEVGLDGDSIPENPIGFVNEALELEVVQ